MNREKRMERLVLYRGIVADRDNSGLSVSEWCRRRGLDRERYYYYKDAIARFEQDEAGDSSATPAARVSLECGDGLRVQISGRIDPDMLMAVMALFAGYTVDSVEQPEP